MNFTTFQKLPAEMLLGAVDQLCLPEDWEISKALHSPSLPGMTAPLNRRTQENMAFQNLVVGRLAETVFRHHHLEPLTNVGYTVVDYRDIPENRDFSLTRGSTELPINVKVASTSFRTAQKVVGLDPADCIPIPAYKAVGAATRSPGLVYVDLVDFSLRDKVNTFMARLDGNLSIAWHLLTWYSGRGAKRAEDRYVQALFDAHREGLVQLVDDPERFRVISARRVLAIMRDNPERVPALVVKGAGTGGWKGEVNVHVSVSHETVPWPEVADLCRHGGISHVMAKINRTVDASIPDPTL